MNGVPDVGLFGLAMCLFVISHEMTIGVHPAMSQIQLPIPRLHITVMIAVGAQTERAATHGYSPLGEGFGRGRDYSGEQQQSGEGAS
jgi:hypothetical protein